MRAMVLGLLVVTGLVSVVVAARAQNGAASVQPTSNRHFERAIAQGGLIALSADGADGRQQITLIDPKTRVMSVYHIDRATGEITLKSVRNVQWDLLMEEFNGTSPSPRDIRQLLQKQ